MQRFLNIDELSDVICLAKQTIYNRVNKGGDLPPLIKLGKSLRWRSSDVEAWIDSKSAVSFAPIQSRRAGRPTKAEEIAKRSNRA
jgi:predicted DNA-binding transcriptional regulator AlpA